MSWKMRWYAVAVVTVMMGCSVGRNEECPFQINLLDGGSSSEISGCGHPPVYDCAAELADGGRTEAWKSNCER